MLRRRLAEAEAALREADRHKDELLATLAHELHDPLAPLLNSVHVITAGVGDRADLVGACGIVERQVRTLARLVDDLLDIARLGRGALELRRERVAFGSIVERVLEVCRPHAEACGHELSVEVPDAQVVLDGDRARLVQLFANLLHNACKFTAPPGHIHLAARREGNELAVEVIDDGPGLRADRLTRVFGVIAHDQPALERAQGGLGTGLAIVRGIAQWHGGTVQAHSAGPGCGSRFVVRLPVAAEGPAAPGAGGASTIAAATRARRILVADDNRDSADSLAMLLRLAGHEVDTVHDGVEALDAAARLRPEVVLLDLGMPNRNGYDTCRLIREQAWGRDMILIAQTGWGADEDRRRTARAGFDAHLLKPLDVDLLLRTIESLRTV